MPTDDGTYDERLWPPVWLWVVGTLFVLSLTVSFYAAAGGALAAVVTVVAGGLLIWGLTTSAARVRVHDGQLTAGPATIPVSLLRDVEVLDAERARAVRGPESDPAAFHLIRGWVPAGVRATVDDPHDPTPYWFIASRHPAQLAAALKQEQPEQGQPR